MRSLRRINTALDQNGRSYVAEDVRIIETATGGIDVWRERCDSIGAGNGENHPSRFYPASGESIFRIVHLPAADAPVSSEHLTAIADQFFQSNNILECRVDTTRHPFMHRTPTLDYVMVISGQVSLLLDHGDPIALSPTDVVIQRMTNHSWINTGSASVSLLVVMIGSTRSSPEDQ